MSDVNIVDQVDETLVEESVHFINAKVAESVFKGSLEIGEYLLLNFFGNDIQLAASQNPAKSVSYSSLCRRPDLAVSRTTLARMVRIAAQEKFLKSKRVRVDSLSYAQRIELIKLENDELKIELARRCIGESLSNRQLIPLVNEVRKATMPPKQDTPSSLAKKHVKELRQLLDGSGVPSFMHDRNQLKSLPREARQTLRETASALQTRLP